MADAVTVIFEIASFSSVMVLIVLGLGVIASMMGIFNFAHGEFVLLGAYTVYLSAEAGLGLWSGMVAAPIVVGLFGFVMERIIIRRFYASPIIAMLGTYAIGLMIRETIRGLARGTVQVDRRADRGRVLDWRDQFLHMADHNHRGDAGCAGGKLVDAGANPTRACAFGVLWKIPCWQGPAASRRRGCTG